MDILDVVIIGSGPAGLSAAVYASRAGIDFAVIESSYVSGGQVLNTYEVDNYLGMYNMNGFAMGMKFREHADKLGAKFVTAQAVKIISDGDNKTVKCSDGSSYTAKNVILATGATPQKLMVEGEERLKGKGVSYCATCDGNFFKGKVVAVVGGGDTAIEDAIYLARICEKVYVIHRRDNFRAAGSLVNRLLDMDNVEVLWNTVVEEICGIDKVESVLVKNTQLDMPGELNVDGVFVAIGSSPQSELLKGIADMDEKGYVLAGENCMTNVSGILVAGDVRKKELRQIITAAADGANAINSVVSHLVDK